MGWRFKWVSSPGNTFNHDFHVSSTPEERAKGRMHYNFGEIAFDGEELPGTSAFYRDTDGQVFHTYSSYARGLDLMMGAYNWLDIAPKGRDDDGLARTMAGCGITTSTCNPDQGESPWVAPLCTLN